MRPQSPPAEAAERRKPATALVFRNNAKSTKPSHRGARYVCGLLGMATIGQRLRRACLAVGVRLADQVVVRTLL